MNLGYTSFIFKRTAEIDEADKERAKDLTRFLNSPTRKWAIHWHWYNVINYKPFKRQQFAEITLLPMVKVVLNRSWNERAYDHGVEFIDYNFVAMFKFWRFATYVRLETWLE